MSALSRRRRYRPDMLTAVLYHRAGTVATALPFLPTAPPAPTRDPPCRPDGTPTPPATVPWLPTPSGSPTPGTHRPIRLRHPLRRPWPTSCAAACACWPLRPPAPAWVGVSGRGLPRSSPTPSDSRSAPAPSPRRQASHRQASPLVPQSAWGRQQVVVVVVLARAKENRPLLRYGSARLARIAPGRAR